MADLAAALHAPMDEWQEVVLEAAMGERTDGRWASKYIGVSAPRQNGKSQIIVARALAGVLLFGEKMIIISAHETDTARQVWKRLIDVIEGNPTLEARVTGRMDAINREFVSFGVGENRQEIKLKARSKSGGRGFSADCLLLDEAQILDKRTWGAINPTVSARPNPQIWLFGTPPTPEDEPYAFARVRESSMKHKARHTWLEWSAAPGDDVNDPEVWAKANPSFGVRISLEACEDDRAAMDDDQFGLERLGVWPAETVGAVDGLDFEAWSMVVDGDTQPAGLSSVVFAVTVTPDRARALVCAAGQRADGVAVVQVAAQGPGTYWVLNWLEARVEDVHPVTVLLDGLAAALEIPLRDRGIPAETTTTADRARAGAEFWDAFGAGMVAHPGQQVLDDSVRTSERKFMAEGFVWTGPASAPLAGVTLAHHGLSTTPAPVATPEPFVMFGA